MIRSKIALSATATCLAAAVFGTSWLASTSRADEPERLAPVPAFSASEQGDFSRAANGDTSAMTPELLSKAAQFYVDRLTQTEYQNPKTPAGPTMDMLYQDAIRYIPVPSAPDQPLDPNKQAFLDAYSKPLVVQLRLVLNNPEQIARVNAARILAYLGRAGAEQAADLMLESINPNAKQSDAVKLYCFRGLKDLLTYGTVKANKKDEIVQALIDYITASHKPPQYQLPGELDAIRYVRREAVRALARWPTPANVGGKQPAALVLLRVMAGDGLVPPPSLSERCAAAEGLCRMKSNKFPGYQPQYAAHQIGRFVADFLTAYNNDLAGKTRTEGWKLLAARLTLALADLAADSKHRDKHIDKVVEEATERLKQVNETGAVDPTPLSDWLNKNPPDLKTLYQDDPTSVVRAKTAPAG